MSLRNGREWAHPFFPFHPSIHLYTTSAWEFLPCSLAKFENQQTFETMAADRRITAWAIYLFIFCNSHEEIETFCLLSYHIVLGIHFAQLLLERGGEAMWGMKRKQDGGWTGGCVWAHDEAIGLSVCVRVCEWLASGNEWERSMWSWDYVIVHPWIHDEYETHQRVVKYCYLYQILSNITFLEHQSYTVHTDRKERVCKEKHECVKIKLNWTEMLHNMRCL